MAKGIYVGIDSKARKVKKAYVGVDNKARKVKKGYIGVAGIARPFFSSEKELVYYGAIPDLDTGRIYLAGASNPNYAVFAGGYTSNSSTVTGATDAYNKNLVKATIDTLSNARTYLGGASNPNYAVFAGGFVTSRIGVADAYDKNLVRASPTGLAESRYQMGATSVGNYACFGGGARNASSSSKYVDFYDANLAKTYLADGLAYGTQYLTGANTPNYALFAGGREGSVGSCKDLVVAFGTNLTKHTPSALKMRRRSAFGVGVGNYAIIAGGARYQGGHIMCADVDIYDDNLVKITADDLPFSIEMPYGVGINREFAVVMQNAKLYVVYDINLVRTTVTLDVVAYQPSASASIGNYGIVCGFGYGYAQALAYQIT